MAYLGAIIYEKTIIMKFISAILVRLKLLVEGISVICNKINFEKCKSEKDKMEHSFCSRISYVVIKKRK